MKPFLLPILAVLSLAVQAFPQVVVDEIIAKVNDEIILRSDFEEQQLLLIQEAANATSQGAPPDEVAAFLEDQNPNVLRDLIDERLLVQVAEGYGLDSDANLQVLRAMENLRQQYNFETMEDLEAAIIAQGDSPDSVRNSIRNQYMREQALNQEVRSRIVITTEEQRAYYDAHMAEFDRDPGVNLAEIVKVVGGLTEVEAAEVRAEMEAIHERLVDGEDFFEIALDESESTTAADGGILGYFGDGMLGPEFEEASRGLTRNQISDIFEVGDALVIIKLLERHTGGVLSFDLARRELDSILMREREVPRVREYLNRLRRDGYVWVHEDFEDTGAVAPSEASADPDGSDAAGE